MGRLQNPAVILTAFKPCLIGFLALAAGYLLVIKRSLKLVKSDVFRVCAAIVGSNFVLLFALASVAHFPFWGRHLAPIFPFFVALIGMALSSSSTDPHNKRGLVLPLYLTATLLLSSLTMRFSKPHAKDDYRSAAQMTRDYLQQNKRVWWMADQQAAEYYQVEEKRGAHPRGEVVFWVNPSLEDLNRQPAPELIVLSKPDIYDQQKALERFVSANRYRLVAQFQAFTLWTRGPTP